MLVFDSAYTHRMMVERNLSSIVCGRDLDGFFEHVWTCHPVASLFLDDSDPGKFGPPDVIGLAPRHTLVEGRIGASRRLRRLFPLNFLIAQVRLVRMLLKLAREQRISIVRAEDSWYNGLLAWIVARRCRLPLMIAVWGNPGAIRARTGKPLMPRLFRKIWVEEMVERFVLRRADRVVTLDEDDRSFVISQGAPREKTRIFRIGNVLHETHFTEPSERQGGLAELEAIGAGGAETLMCISRLEALKFTDHLVRILGILKDRRPRAKVLFVGDGAQKEELAALASELGVADRVVFCGNRDQDWLARVLPHVSVVVSPLTGRALAEAALGGAPIVAYDLVWHREMVIPGETGEIVPNLDVEAMAEAVDRLLADPHRARRLGDAVRRHAFAMLDPAAADRVQKEAYQELLAERA
jgi:glycosyltransferase involved in cell wall biosynthesis